VIDVAIHFRRTEARVEVERSGSVQSIQAEALAAMVLNAGGVVLEPGTQRCEGRAK